MICFFQRALILQSTMVLVFLFAPLAAASCVSTTAYWTDNAKLKWSDPSPAGHAVGGASFSLHAALDAADVARSDVALPQGMLSLGVDLRRRANSWVDDGASVPLQYDHPHWASTHAALAHSPLSSLPPSELGREQMYDIVLTTVVGDDADRWKLERQACESFAAMFSQDEQEGRRGLAEACCVQRAALHSGAGGAEGCYMALSPAVVCSEISSDLHAPGATTMCLSKRFEVNTKLDNMYLHECHNHPRTPLP